jgi:hypothetical protein
MALSKKEEKRVSSRVFGCLNLVVGVVLVVVGVCCWKMGASTITTVNQGLVDQKIYFPPAGSPGFAAEAFPKAQKYAGKQVVDGALAKAYAEDFLGAQLKLVGNGKVSSEVAAALAMDPTNAMLQQQSMTMFQLDTSKTLMLSSGYGAWYQAKMIKNMGLVALIAGLVLLGASAVQMMMYKKLQ